MTVMNKFKSGDIAYHISNSTYVREVKILRVASGFCTIQFADNMSSSRVRESKLYRTEKDAQSIVDKLKNERKYVEPRY